MKPAFATALSVAGVLAAGTAAFAVNTSVLGASSKTDAAVVTTIAPVDLVLDQMTGGIAAQDQSLTNAEATPVDDSTTTYKVGEAGSVVLSTASGSLEVVSIMPAGGWEAEPAITGARGSVKVHFYSTSTRLEFRAVLIDGKVSVSVTTDDVDGPQAPAGPGQKVDDDHDSDDGYHENDDDDDDESYEHEDDGDEHEDGEHEDDD